MKLFWRRCRGERRFLQGESLTSNLLLCYCFALLYFCLHHFIKNTHKISSFIVAFTYLLLVLLEWVLLRTPSCVILLAPKIMILSALLTSGKKPIGGAPFWHMRGAYGMRHHCHATNNSLLVAHVNMRH
jgi:hypothetical protein